MCTPETLVISFPTRSAGRQWGAGQKEVTRKVEVARRARRPLERAQVEGAGPGGCERGAARRGGRREACGRTRALWECGAGSGGGAESCWARAPRSAGAEGGRSLYCAGPRGCSQLPRGGGGGPGSALGSGGGETSRPRPQLDLSCCSRPPGVTSEGRLFHLTANGREVTLSRVLEVRGFLVPVLSERSEFPVGWQVGTKSSLQARASIDGSSTPSFYCTWRTEGTFALGCFFSRTTLERLLAALNLTPLVVCSPATALEPGNTSTQRVTIELSAGVSSAQFGRSVVSDSLRPHEPQHARPPCPSPTPGVY